MSELELLKSENLEVVEKVQINSEVEIKPLPDEIVPSIKEKKATKSNDLFSDIFIKDDDFFQCKVLYYKDGKTMNVKDVTENFDPNHKDLKEFNFWCKYPNAIETEGLMLILAQKISSDGTNSFQASDFLFVQIARLKLLLKKWDAALSIKSLDKIDPYILKGMLNSVMEELGNKGLF